jgi:four helix bundle protein
MKDFRMLQVWRRGHELTLALYKATAAFPRHEQYGIVSQIRRAAASIPTNVAEGCGRRGPAELARFMHIAMGSASELEYILLLARDLGYLCPDEHEQLHNQCTSLKRMLACFIRKLNSDTLTAVVDRRSAIVDCKK